MIFWSIFLPLTALSFILYFQFIDKLFGGRKRPFLIRKKEQHKIPAREVISTWINLLIFASAGLLVGWLIENDYSQIHNERPTTFTDYLLLFVTFFAALGIHDFYFYCSHRFLHTKIVFRYVHAPHHLSHEVSPWSAFSFHPIEALIQIGIVILLSVILPMHIGVLIAFSILMMLISVYGHCGYELRLNKWEGFNIFNTSFHHYQHHKEVHYNFGIYLSVWDKLFKTESPKYAKLFGALKTRASDKLGHQKVTPSNHD